MTDEQWSRVLDVTLNGTFRCTRAQHRASRSGLRDLHQLAELATSSSYSSGATET
jgi:NAD(P)-dependent dehydrogenase (short-subunit alcohol dehydrogenase family)